MIDSCYSGSGPRFTVIHTFLAVEYLEILLNDTFVMWTLICKGLQVQDWIPLLRDCHGDIFKTSVHMYNYNEKQFIIGPETIARTHNLTR